MITIIDVPQNSDDWLKLREGKITGSIADKLLRWGQEESMELNAGRKKLHTFYIKRGHVLEDEALELYASIHDVTVQRPGFVLNSKFPNAACSPDGIANDYLLEVKAYAIKKHLAIVNRKTIPFKIMAQLQFNLLICGLKRAILIMYNPDIDDPKLAYKEIVVRRDLKIHNNMMDKLRNKK